MKSRSLIVSFLAVLMVLAAPTAGQTPEAASRPAGYLTELTAEDRNVVVVGDLLPHIQGILQSKSLERWLTEGQFGRFLRSSGVRVDMEAARQAVEGVASYIPEEIAIGIPESAVQDVDHLTLALMYARYSAGAVGAGEAGKKELGGLQDGILAELKKLRVPTIRLWVKFRDERTARTVMQLVSVGMRGVRQEYPDAVKMKADAVEISGTVGTFLNTQLLSQALENLGIVEDADDAKSDAMATALARVVLEGKIERIGSGIKLTLGKPAAANAPTLASAKLGAAFKVDGSTLAAANWELGSTKKAMRGWLKLAEEKANTAAGRRATADDVEGLGGDLERFARMLLKAGDRGSTRIVVGQGLRGEWIEENVATGKTLADLGWRKLIPADVESFYLTADASVGDWFASQLDQIEGRMSMNSLKATLSDKVTPEVVMETKYYASFQKFRDLVLNKGPEEFLPSSAMLISSRGKVERFEVSFADEGGLRSVTLKDVPVLELAVMGPVKDAGSAQKHIAATYEALVRAFYGASEVDPPDRLAGVVKSDLGLGVETWGFDGKWLRDVTGEVEAQVRATGDIVPHFFIVDEVMVFSTSPRLSKSILAGRASGKGPALPETNRPLVGVGHVDTRTMVEMCKDLGIWTDKFMGQLGPAGAKGRAMVRIFEGMAEGAALIKGLDWTTTQGEQGVRTTVWKLGVKGE